MIKYIIIIILLASCADNKSVQPKNDMELSKGDSVLTNNSKPGVRYDLLKQDAFSADSVILLSHHSPNMPIKNSKTGDYYKKSIPFIEHDTINYKTSVQERKKLNKTEIEELLAILMLPAVGDSITTMCFQPRNAVVFFKGDKISFFDFCFDCYEFAAYGNFRSKLIMNSEKYRKLLTLYIKYDFKYELQ